MKHSLQSRLVEYMCLLEFTFGTQKSSNHESPWSPKNPNSEPTNWVRHNTRMNSYTVIYKLIFKMFTIFFGKLIWVKKFNFVIRIIAVTNIQFSFWDLIDLVTHQWICGFRISIHLMTSVMIFMKSIFRKSFFLFLSICMYKFPWHSSEIRCLFSTL